MAGSHLQGIAPCFIVTDVEPTIAFYRDKLGFEEQFKAPDEGAFFAIVARDDVMIFIKAERGVLPVPNHTRHEHLRLDAFVSVPDPDALAAEFEGRGVVFSEVLKDTHDGLRGFEVRDPNGYVLFFGRPNV